MQSGTTRCSVSKKRRNRGKLKPCQLPIKGLRKIIVLGWSHSGSRIAQILVTINVTNPSFGVFWCFGGCFFVFFVFIREGAGKTVMGGYAEEGGFHKR